MNEIVIEKSDKGWIVELPDDFSQEIGVEKGSIAVLRGSEGKIEAEIIAPSPEIKKSVDRIYDKWKDAFTEIKRIGD
jgi:hypothetical protein